MKLNIIDVVKHNRQTLSSIESKRLKIFQRLLNDVITTVIFWKLIIVMLNLYNISFINLAQQINIA